MDAPLANYGPRKEAEAGPTGGGTLPGRPWESAAGALAAAGLTLILGTSIPGMIACPLLYSWLALRHGIRIAALGVGVGVAGSLVLGGVGGSLAAVLWGSTGSLLAWGIRRGKSPGWAVRLSAVPLSVLSVAQGALVGQSDARARFLADLERAFTEAARFPSLVGSKPEDLEAARSLAARVGEVLWLLTPGIGVVTAVAVGFLVYRAGQWLFPKRGVRVPPMAPFRSWALRQGFTWVLALGLFLEVLRVDAARVLGHNVLWVVGCAYLVQGASLLAYALESRRVPRVGRAVVWFAGLLLLQPVSGIAAVVAGFLDTWVDFRSRHRPHPA